MNKQTLAGQMQELRAAWFELLAAVAAELPWPTLKEAATAKAKKERAAVEDYGVGGGGKE